MRRKILAGIIVVLLLIALVSALSDTPPASDVIMTGTALIAGMVQDLTGNLTDGKPEVRNLIPPGMCPGQFDIEPSDVRALANSRVFIIHTWQQNQTHIVGLIRAARNPDLIVMAINVTGNWMVPAVQAQAVAKIAQALGEIDPENAAYYQQRAADRVQDILDKGKEIEDRLSDAGVGNVTVICAAVQEGFVRWAGFDVVATYGRPEDLTVAKVEELIVTAREAGVALVIDNLQSGATATSETMAQDIGAIQVTISNFPGGLENTETWEKALDKNVALLLEALNEWRKQYG